MTYRYRDQHSRLSGERFIRCDKAHDRPHGRRSLQLWYVCASVRACACACVRVYVCGGGGDVMTVVIVVLVVYIYLYVCGGVWG